MILFKNLAGKKLKAYHYNDKLQIANHYVNELKSFIQNKLSVILYTDLLTLQIWYEFKYKKCHPLIMKTLN